MQFDNSNPLEEQFYNLQVCCDRLLIIKNTVRQSISTEDHDMMVRLLSDIEFLNNNFNIKNKYHLLQQSDLLAIHNIINTFLVIYLGNYHLYNHELMTQLHDEHKCILKLLSV